MSSKDPGKPVPRSVIRRLTECLAHVRHLRGKGVEWISSQELADDLGLTSSTVRQDLSHLDFSGISKRGYRAAGLEQALAGMLGADTVWTMVVVGAGNLGRALSLHEQFPRHGFNIVGVFDADERKVGCRVGSLVVQPMRELPATVAAAKADIGVLAVPATSAQDVADELVAAGIKGLLNIALAHISVPPSVPVIDSRIVAHLQELSHAIKALDRD